VQLFGIYFLTGAAANDESLNTEGPRLYLAALNRELCHTPLNGLKALGYILPPLIVNFATRR